MRPSGSCKRVTSVGYVEFRRAIYVSELYASRMCVGCHNRSTHIFVTSVESPAFFRGPSYSMYIESGFAACADWPKLFGDENLRRMSVPVPPKAIESDPSPSPST